MKKLVVILLASLVATSAFAVIDPDTDSIGVYFDTNADLNCIDFIGGFMDILPVYIVWTNPSASSFTGYEFGYTNEVSTGAMIMLGGTSYFNGVSVDASDVYTGQTLQTGEHSVVTSVAIPTCPATILQRWDFVCMGGSVDFFLYKGINAIGAILPQVLSGDGDKIQLMQSTGGDDIPVGMLNPVGDCVVSVEETSFGSVKSLFR